jgi:hypothetical protein
MSNVESNPSDQSLRSAIMRRFPGLALVSERDARCWWRGAWVSIGVGVLFLEEAVRGFLRHRGPVGEGEQLAYLFLGIAGALSLGAGISSLLTSKHLKLLARIRETLESNAR